MVEVVLVTREDDGLGWYGEGRVYINCRWIGEEEAEETISLTFLHEYVEHVLGLGHSRAEYVERAVQTLLAGGEE